MSARIVKYSIIVFLVLISVKVGSAQACGNIYAKFYVHDASDRLVDTAKIRLLRSGSDESIAYSEKEIRFLVEEGAYEFRHGLCGSHRDTRLIIEHPNFEKFESTVDLSLNTPRTEHVFSIVLKRAGTSEIPVIEQWAVLTGDVKDRAGNPLQNILLSLVGRDGHLKKSQTDRYGIFSFQVKQGEYSLEAHLPGSGEKVRHEEMLLKPGLNSHDVAFGVVKKN